MVFNALTCHRLFGTIEHDVHLITLPLFHSFGQTVQLNAGFGTGATLVLLPRFHPATALATMQRERVTFSPAYQRCIAPTRRGHVGGQSGCHRGNLADVGDRSLATFNHPDPEAKPGSIGQPV